MRRIVIGAAAVAFLASGIMVAVSCSAPPTQTYGNPNGLDRKNIPGEGGGITPLACSGGDGGGSATLPDGGCGISFTSDLLPYFAVSGHCSDAVCHGAGKQAPAVTCSPDGGAGPCIASLKAISVGGTPYLGGGGDSGSDPSIICNLQSSCGNGMPQAPGKAPTNDDLCKLSAWISCGSPAN